MKRLILGAVVGGVVVATGALAHDRWGTTRDGMGHHPGPGMMGQISPEDAEALTDARMAAVHAGLKLSADQDKLWPPVEDALRTLARQRREQRRAWRDADAQGGQAAAGDDLPARLRAVADRQAARADALRRLADATAPLYGTLDEGQKRRLRVLARFVGPHRDRMAARMPMGGYDARQP